VSTSRREVPHLTPALHAPDAASWLATHLAARWATRVQPGVAARLVTLTAVLADDASALRGLHGRLVDDGVPGPAAATHLADWFAGSVASAVGFGLAVGAAGFLPAGPRTVLHLHPDGWPMRVDLPPQVVVAAGHPWSGHAGVEVVTDHGAVVRRAVGALVDAAEPVVQACRGLARVGRAGLWNEVADGLGAALAHQDAVVVTDPMVATLEAAITGPGVPWRARPTLGFVDSPALGRVHVVQKGGCCLAYTRPVADEPADEPDLDPDRRDFLARFPVRPGEPAYCTTCSFREPGDAAARQVFWRERARAT